MQERSPSPIPRRNRLRRIAFVAGGTMLLAGVLLCAFVAVRPGLLEKTSFSTAYYDRDRHLLRLTLANDDRYRLYTPLAKISPDLITATLAQEDRHFYQHAGVKMTSLARAVYETYLRRSRSQGGSTITMQVVRLRDHLNTTTLSGKAIQILRSLQLEAHYNKDQILEAYLNLAPYGGNIEGVGAASLIYFRQRAQTLALPESLALAVIPQNPVKRSPLKGDAEVWRNARLRLFETLPPTYAVYRPQMDLKLVARSPAELPFLAPHFVGGLQRTPGDVATSLDLDLQKMMEQRMKDWGERQKQFGIDNAAAILVHFPTMQIRGLVGSADFFNPGIQGQVDGTEARRSPGSALKPFIYALAIDQGLIHPGTLLNDSPESFGDYRPENFDRAYVGKITARDALVMSRNLPAISLTARIRPGFYDFLQETGAKLPHEKDYYGLSLAVGGAEVDMHYMARAYAMLANGGNLRDLSDGTIRPSIPDRQVMSPEAALLTTLMLDHPAPDSLAFTTIDRTIPIYWKTGTSSGFHDAWTAGIFGSYVMVVWTGHFDGRSNQSFVGVDRAAPLFFDMARAVIAREKSTDLVKSALKSRNISLVDICAATGTPGACGGTQSGWFIPGKSPFAVMNRTANGPAIISPRPGITYVASTQSGARLQIPLKAGNIKTEDTIYWFDGTTLIGTTASDMPIIWSPNPGLHTLNLVNSAGQSATQSVNIMSAE